MSSSMLPRKEKMMFYLSLLLLIFVVIGLSVMGIRTLFNPSRFEFFNQVGLSQAAVLAWAAYTVLGALLMALPRTFVSGCVMLLLNNLYIIGVYVKSGNIGSIRSPGDGPPHRPYVARSPVLAVDAAHHVGVTTDNSNAASPETDRKGCKK